jgi:hypothetical protein
MTDIATVVGISSSACFYPEEDDPANFDGTTVTWTFELPKSVRTGPGLYRIEFVRNLTAEERSQKSAVLFAEAVPRESAQDDGHD